MHECGWVHRDISITNILVDDQGLAKLADVEYAKRIDDLNSHSVRTVRLYPPVIDLPTDILCTRVLSISRRLNSTLMNTCFCTRIEGKNREPAIPSRSAAIISVI